MKALKIIIGREKITLGPPSEKGVATFIITVKEENGIRIDAGGYDPESDINYDWIKEELSSPEEIRIQLMDNIETSQFSEPISRREAKSLDLVNNEKLKYYFRLKRELEEKGLI